MKKIMIVLLFCILVAFPAAAKSDVSLGVGVGTSTFLTTRMDLNRNTSAVLNLGFGHWGTEGFYIRPQMQYGQSDKRFEIERQDFYPYIGWAVPIGLWSQLDLSVNAVLGVSSYFNDNLIEIYLEALPGLELVRSGEFGMGFDLGVTLGARYSL